jgi:hypothetical protein
MGVILLLFLSYVLMSLFVCAFIFVLLAFNSLVTGGACGNRQPFRKLKQNAEEGT